MYRTRTVGIVVPAYNEEEHIADVLSGVPGFVDAVYVVDDASTDRTADIVRAARGFASVSSHVLSPTDPQAAGGNLQEQVKPAKLEFRMRNSSTGGPRVELIQHAINRGVGAAIATGYRRCLAEGLDIAVVMAGDNQMDPAELPRLLAPVVEGMADYAKGDRTSRREHLAGMPAWRRFGNRLLMRLTRIATGMRVNDPQNGYTAASRDLLAALPLSDLYPRYGYCNQLLAWTVANGGRLVEVPMRARYRGERSKIRYRSYVPGVSFVLLRLAIDRAARRCGAGRDRRGALVPSTFCAWPPAPAMGPLPLCSSRVPSL